MSKPDSCISSDISTKFAALSLEEYESQVRMEIAAMRIEVRVVELEERTIPCDAAERDDPQETSV